ncbi:WD repeat-containing protein WDS homolog [Abrus precatorius]|uniref:WD repeat-containing protein WDS homolog n=1 Tax=Abrus precatorius TaxID=3816 RepID=A0A8B8KYM9_ABRPR|nr:WD repeat-containing protein WDS homolog [Abrus precatorius]
MENPSEVVGSKGLIRKHEFVRVIIQSLYSLGYNNTASCLESESGISYKSTEFQMIESHILNGNWSDCIDYLNSLKDVLGETIECVMFLVLKQLVVEYMNRGEDTLALGVLQKEVSVSDVDKYILVNSIISSKDRKLGAIDDNGVQDLRRKLLKDLENLLAPPISLPGARLEYLVESTVAFWIDSCTYHSSSNPISLYEDHRCSRDHIPTTTTQILTAHTNEVWVVQFSNRGMYLASSSNDCTAIIWEMLEDWKFKLKHTLSGHRLAVSYVAWSPDDTKLLTCGNLEVLKLWDVETGTCMHTFGSESFGVNSCAWFPDSKHFMGGSSHNERGICVWNCDGKEVSAWKGRRKPKVVDVAITPDGGYLISIFVDLQIRILHVPTKTERVIEEDYAMASLSLSGDGKFLIVNLSSQEIHMWDVAGKWDKPMKFMGHKQQRFAIRSCFGGFNNSFIASGSENSQVYIWNWRHSNPIEILCGHSAIVNCVSWNPKIPHMLASASDDHTIRIWGPSSASDKQEGKPSSASDKQEGKLSD